MAKRFEVGEDGWTRVIEDAAENTVSETALTIDNTKMTTDEIIADVNQILHDTGRINCGEMPLTDKGDILQAKSKQRQSETSAKKKKDKLNQKEKAPRTRQPSNTKTDKRHVRKNNKNCAQDNYSDVLKGVEKEAGLGLLWMLLIVGVIFGILWVVTLVTPLTWMNYLEIIVWCVVKVLIWMYEIFYAFVDMCMTWMFSKFGITF